MEQRYFLRLSIADIILSPSYILVAMLLDCELSELIVFP